MNARKLLAIAATTALMLVSAPGGAQGWVSAEGATGYLAAAPGRTQAWVSAEGDTGYAASAPDWAQVALLNDDTYVEIVEDSVAKAESAYAAGRFREAYQFFYWAAIRDHARAQEVVGVMLLLGSDIYGPQVSADRGEAVFWLQQAAARGRPTAAYLAAALDRAKTARSEYANRLN